jgi:hypothetical protein
MRGPMPFEFALRPRFRLDERVVPPRRRELPRIVLPVAAYWLGTAALTYGLVYAKPTEAARARSAAATAKHAPRRHSPARRALAEPRADSSQEVGSSAALRADSSQEVASSASLEQETSELVTTQLSPEPEVTGSDAPREAAYVPPLAAPPELPVVPPPRDSAPPRVERTVEPRRWLFESAPASRSSDLSASDVSREPSNEVRSTGGTLPSCEDVAADATQELDLRSRQRAPDLSREALAGVLERGAYLTACGVPERTTLEVCVAVQEGKVKGATVSTSPANARVAACVRRAVGRLSFPYSPHLDLTRTHFDAAR